MKRYRLFWDRPVQGFMAGHGMSTRMTRIVEIKDGDPVPDDAVAVDDATPLTEWQEVKP